MTTATRLQVGTLGGPGTFAHQATEHMRKLYPELGDVTYFPSMEDVWDALESRKVDVIVSTEQTSRLGFSEADRRVALPDSQIYVYAEAVVPYGCALLVKPGTRLQDLRAVYGHGSLRQCKAWLDANLPNVPTAVHEKNSVEAAKEVAAGDGTTAVVGTLLTAEMTGLVPLARDIDDGASGNWWALSLTPHFSERPDRLLVAGRFRGDGDLGDATTGLAKLGYRLRTAYAQPTGKALFEYDYLLSFLGQGELAAVQQELARIGSARLVAAYEARG